MTSPLRWIIAPRTSWSSPTAAWAAVGTLLLASALIILRACGYESDTVAGYLAYLFFYVLLPGAVAMQFIRQGSLSLVETVALAVPTGFAIEVFTFLAFSAVDAREAYASAPLAWIALATLQRWRMGAWPWRVNLSAHHAGLAVLLALTFLGTIAMAASQMFAESPLANGLPTRAIFHDWVYLVSRAGVIKNNWPLDDPSLSGTPLQYHYFMMVHAAAASWTTGVEITAVLLRLMVVPLGAALVAQAFVLGRAVSRSPWGGALAALFTVMASEASMASSYGQPMFLGLFVRWLFVSPTFFFGMIYCGALLLAVGRCARLARCDARHLAWLLLLGTAGTGAKGTLLPVLVCALGLWTLWRWVKERRLPKRLVVFAAGLTFAFLLVYVPTMSAWHTGDAAFRPFHVFQLTEFWKHYLPLWQQWFAQALPVPVANVTATLACAAVVFAGTCGVRLLALPYLFWGDLQRRDTLLVGWLGAFFAASCGMGLLMELNSYGELYLVLMIRLPMAVLAAAFVVSATRGIRAWWRQAPGQAADSSASPFAPALVVRPAARVRSWLPHVLVASGIGVFAVALVLQTWLWIARNRTGFREWLATPANLQPDDYMRTLQEALLWVRDNTEPDAVLVANSCTPENMKKDHWGALDRTLTGVHFYYSALSERRLWFEGPNYIMDTTRARIRASLASNFFYRRRPLSSALVNDGPSYVLVDRSLPDHASLALPKHERVFANSRIEIYRLSGGEAADPPVEVAAAGDSH